MGAKLVNSNRGGYCFELNSLLLLALCHFGFNARPILGRVHLSGEVTGRGHLLILAELIRYELDC
ncbi:arylamine N-acetyltransferase [Pontibacterium sp.]|uniref:arylamine N-acetyltransferase n=1 Tax=Pontibacterium sp. TaxID=2036026 RepID=UPI00356722A8